MGDRSAIVEARWAAADVAKATGCRSVADFMDLAKGELVEINAARARAGDFKSDMPVQRTEPRRN